MRFNPDDYLKAFPRETNKPMKVEVVNQGNVIEEAQPVNKGTIQGDPEGPGNVISEAPDADDAADQAQEGAEDGI